jgi:hypothetical protein
LCHSFSYHLARAAGRHLGNPGGFSHTGDERLWLARPELKRRGMGLLQLWQRHRVLLGAADATIQGIGDDQRLLHMVLVMIQAFDMG